MKRMRSILATILTIMVILQLPIVTLAAEIPPATSDFYVNDFAEVFTSEEKTQLMEKAVALSDNNNGIQVVITTIKSLDGDTVENYAYNMYNQYGIGKDDMGLLILLSTGDRQIRVEVGKAMEAYVNDAKAGRFIDKYAIPYLKENKFNEGLIKLQENLINEIVSKIETENQQGTVSATTKPEKTSTIKPATILFWVLTVILVGGLIFLIMIVIKKQKEKKETIESLKAQLEEAEELKLEEKKRHSSELEMYSERIREIRNDFERKKSELVYNHIDEKNSLETKIKSLRNEKSSLEGRCKSLEDQLSAIKDRYRRINVIHPNADKEVDKMIAEEIRQKDMAEAKKVDQAIAKVINLSADKDKVSDFKSVSSMYSNLTSKQKTYVKGDMKAVEKLYEESERLKKEYDKKVEKENNQREARQATENIKSLIASIATGNEKNLNQLKKAKSIYNNLSRGACTYFEISLITKVNNLLHEAEADFERNEKIRKHKASAEDAENQIKRIISYKYGRESELRDLESAMSIYKRLDSDVEKYFDQSVLRELKDLIQKAKRDKRENEEEEERRRRNSYNSYSSFNNHSDFGGSSGFGGGGFSGFGGSSGGGGASRGF